MATSQVLSFAIKAVNEASATLNKIQKDVDEVTNAATKGTKSIGGFGSAVGKASALTTGLGVGAGIAAATGVAALVKGVAATADALDEASARTGLSTTALQELRHAANLSGSSLDGLETAVKRMSSVITDAQDGAAGATEALGKLGLRADDLVGLGVDKQFMKIADALAAVEDDTRRASLAQDIFGKSGADLLPMLADGAEGLAKMRKEAHDLGNVMSEEDVKKAAELNDMIEKLGLRLDGLKQQIGTAMIPVLLNMADVFSTQVWPAIKAVADVVELLTGLIRDAVRELDKLPNVGGDPAKGGLGTSIVKGGLSNAMGQLFPASRIGSNVERIKRDLGFEDGGWVPGPIGAPQLIMAHGGELVVPTDGPFPVDPNGMMAMYARWLASLGRRDPQAMDYTLVDNQRVDVTGVDDRRPPIVSRTGLYGASYFDVWDWNRPADPNPDAADRGMGQIPGVDFQVDEFGNRIEEDDPRWDPYHPSNRVRGNFANGGIVPGPRGAPMLATVHGGETILPTHKGGGYGGTTVIINVSGAVIGTQMELARLIRDVLGGEMQRGSLGLS